LAAAEPLLLEALKGQLASLGELHIDTLCSTAELAKLRFEQGRHAEAEASLRRALTGQHSTLGRQHAHTLATQSSLEAVLRAQGRSAGEARGQAALE
jgi:hypothetical protein